MRRRELHSGPEDSRLAAAKRALEWVQQKRAEAEAKKHPEPEPDPNSHLSLDQCMTRIRQGFPEAKTGYWGLCTCIYPGPPYSSAALCTSASHLWSARRALAHLEKHYPKAFAAADAPEKPKLPVIGTMTMDETAAELRRRGWHTELRGDIRTWVSPRQTDYDCADGETHIEHNRSALAKARALDGDA